MSKEGKTKKTAPAKRNSNKTTHKEMGHRPERRKEAEAETFDRTASNWYLGSKHYESRGSRVMRETRAQSLCVCLCIVCECVQ